MTHGLTNKQREGVSLSVGQVGWSGPFGLVSWALAVDLQIGCKL